LEQQVEHLQTKVEKHQLKYGQRKRHVREVLVEQEIRPPVSPQKSQIRPVGVENGRVDTAGNHGLLLPSMQLADPVLVALATKEQGKKSSQRLLHHQAVALVQ
jgi:hypothetical protein